MRIKSLLIAVVLIFLVGSKTIASDYVPGELLVKYKPGTYTQNLQGELGKIGWAKIRIERSKSMSQAMISLKNDPDIIQVEPNYYGEFLSVPNDPYFDQQWYLNNTGQTGGTEDADIDALEAWDISLGQGVIIGLVDSGVDLTHEDLVDNLLPDGWDFADDDNDPTDEVGHGTQLCGIIAASQNNALGISGVAPESKILPLKISEGNPPTLLDSAVAEAIIYASDYGARVINLSLKFGEEPQVITDAIDYATSKGVLLVAAAGQFEGEVVTFPAKLEEVIAVSATNHNDELWFRSNFGSEIELSAPGVNIYTTKMGGGYDDGNGTSFSSAVVSSVAALLIAHYPGLTRDQVRERLTMSADDLGDPGKDELFGYGRVNALRVLDPGDADDDGILDDDDNCPYVPNGPDGGTCTEGDVGNNCLNNGDCGTAGSCSMNQEDFDDDGIGDVCEGSATTTSTTTSTTTTTVLSSTTTAVLTTTSAVSSTTTTCLELCWIEELYGEYSEEVAILRYLRDNVLNKTKEGQEIVRLYYEWSPLIVKAIENDEEFKEELKEMLDRVLLLLIFI